MRSLFIQFLLIQTVFTPFFHLAQNYDFVNPVGIPLSISAYFGALRSNHFHMGVDYRAPEGTELRSIDHGYVSRVKINPYGYGKVVHINHPNGLTSVYAHCSKMVGKLDSVVTELLITKQNNEIDVYLSPLDVPLTKGEVFALSGNTGNSSGPHLHFELRETATEVGINPLLFGLGNKDNIKPKISSIKVYGLSKEGYLISSKSKIIGVSNGKLITGDRLILPSNFCTLNGFIGIGISGIDQHSTGSCGLYENKISVNNSPHYHTRLDKVAFEDTRYINSYKDYSGFKSGNKIHKLFKNGMNKLDVNPFKSNGFISLLPGESAPVLIETFDIANNSDKTKFILEIASGAIDSTINFFPSEQYWIPNNTYQIKLKQSDIKFDKLSLYEPVPIKIIDEGLKITIGSSNYAIQAPLIVEFQNFQSLNTPTEKYFIGYLNGSKYEYYETIWDDNKLIAKANKFGTYKVLIDTVKPKIQIKNFTSTLFTGKNKTLYWSILDHESKIKKYDVFINDNWLPASYEYKDNSLGCKINIPLNQIKTIRVEVTDVCGNKNKLVTNVKFP